MNERFEVKDVYLSNAILEKEEFLPHKLLNITVRCNMEEIQDWKVQKPTTHEELADMFGEVAKEAFLRYCQHTPDDNQDKVKLLGFLAHPVTEKAEAGEFGWYKLNNENKETSNG